MILHFYEHPNLTLISESIYNKSTDGNNNVLSTRLLHVFSVVKILLLCYCREVLQVSVISA
jgi:hypothetical protein